MKAQGFPEMAGRAGITPMYNLPSKYVIHTVGPIVKDKVTREDGETLSSCYRECLRRAEDNGLESIAFCCISTGVYRFPPRRKAEIAVKTVEDHLRKGSSIRRVTFNVFRDEDKRIYTELLSR